MNHPSSSLISLEIPLTLTYFLSLYVAYNVTQRRSRCVCTPCVPPYFLSDLASFTQHSYSTLSLHASPLPAGGVSEEQSLNRPAVLHRFSRVQASGAFWFRTVSQSSCCEHACTSICVLELLFAAHVGAAPCGRCIRHCLRNCQTVFSGGGPALHPHEPCRRLRGFLHFPSSTWYSPCF